MRTVRFAARFEFLDEIRDFVGAIAREAGFDDRDVYNIQLAADEAASNIMEHAYAGVTDGVLEIACGMNGDAIHIVFVDHGDPFDPSDVPAPDLKADLSERKIGGLGIYLMRRLMDEVHYRSDPGKSNTLTLIKRKA
jgi:anti-sigma regulatory factor (Ser/Thr protein kinase)